MGLCTKITATAVAGIVALAGVASATELKLASIAPSKSIWAAQVQRYADKVAELSGGDLTINTFFDAQLGNMGDTLKNTLSGRNDIWIGATPVLGAVTGELQLFTLPYMFKGADDAGCIVTKLTPNVQAAAGKKFKYLGTTPVGTQAIAADKPMLMPEDLAGYKIRTAPLKASIEFFDSVGATPLPLAAAETAAAASTGLVDAADFTIVYLVLTGTNKALPVYTRTNQIYNLGGMIVGAKAWAGLSDSQKKVMEDAMVALEFTNAAAEVAAFEAKMEGAHKKKGGSIVELSDEQHAAWEAAGKASWETAMTEIKGDAPGFMAAIDAARAECTN